jgi:formylglycine-generating enzyme required for sulfatase activity
MMGSEKGANDEKPVHKVTLKAFYMDRCEVANEKYYVFTKLSGCAAPGHWHEWAMPKDFELHPVVCVTWDDAKAYADWLGMRLPTEAEWEYACRARSEEEYCFGDNESDLDEYCWYWKNSDRETHPVGTKRPNAWGLYDMHGNAWEWCQDWHDENYYAQSPAADPQGPKSGAYHILRGGGWSASAGTCRSADRDRLNPVSPHINTGFRVCSFGP